MNNRAFILLSLFLFVSACESDEKEELLLELPEARTLIWSWGKEISFANSKAHRESAYNVSEGHGLLEVRAGYRGNTGDYLKFMSLDRVESSGQYLGRANIKTSIECGAADSPSMPFAAALVKTEALDYFYVVEEPEFCFEWLDTKLLSKVVDIEYSVVDSGATKLEEPGTKHLRAMVSEYGSRPRLDTFYSIIDVANSTSFSDEVGVIAISIGEQNLELEKIEISNIRRHGESIFESYGYMFVEVDVYESCGESDQFNTHYIVASMAKNDYARVYFKENLIRCEQNR